MTESQANQYLKTAQEALNTPNVFSSTLRIVLDDLRQIQLKTDGRLNQEINKMIVKLNDRITNG